MSQSVGRSFRPWTPWSEIRETARRIGRAQPDHRPVLRAFARWLYRERGLAAGSITVRVHLAAVLVDALTSDSGSDCRATVSAMSCAEVERFFVRYGRDHGMASRRNMQAAMRLFFGFAEQQGWAGPELREAVPKLRSVRLKSLPRAIREEELRTLLTESWDQGACPRRDRAIILLLATYGVRRGQISRLRFEDLDWQERLITFGAHKGGSPVRQALSAAAGEALSEYLGHERPPCRDPHVFLRHRRPHLRLSPAAITGVVYSRMRRCGLPQRSAHAFRHAFASRLLSNGQSMKVISDLLGHQSLEAVAIYAKVDFHALSQCCVEWPEVSS